MSQSVSERTRTKSDRLFRSRSVVVVDGSGIDSYEITLEHGE